MVLLVQRGAVYCNDDCRQNSGSRTKRKMKNHCYISQTGMILIKMLKKKNIERFA